VILDQTRRWMNLVALVIELRAPQARILELCPEPPFE
jgi:hypothetical protein